MNGSERAVQVRRPRGLAVIIVSQRSKTWLQRLTARVPSVQIVCQRWSVFSSEVVHSSVPASVEFAKASPRSAIRLQRWSPPRRLTIDGEAEPLDGLCGDRRILNVQ